MIGKLGEGSFPAPITTCHQSCLNIVKWCMGTVCSSVTFVWYFSWWSAVSVSGQSVYIKQIANVSWNSPDTGEWGVRRGQTSTFEPVWSPLLSSAGNVERKFCSHWAAVHLWARLGGGSAAWSAGVQVLTFVTKSKVHCLKQSKYCGENCSAECTGGAQCHGYRTGAGWTPHITANTITLCGSYLRRWLFLKVLSLAARKV